jgi:hypothetical protein
VAEEAAAVAEEAAAVAEEAAAVEAVEEEAAELMHR